MKIKTWALAAVLAVLALSLAAGTADGRRVEAAAATLTITGTATLEVRGYPDGYWSQVIFQSEAYKGGKPEERYLRANCSDVDRMQDYTPTIDRRTGTAAMPYQTGESWANCFAYVALTSDPGVPISNVVTFSIP